MSCRQLMWSCRHDNALCHTKQLKMTMAGIMTVAFVRPQHLRAQHSPAAHGLGRVSGQRTATAPTVEEATGCSGVSWATKLAFTAEIRQCWGAAAIRAFRHRVYVRLSGSGQLEVGQEPGVFVGKGAPGRKASPGEQLQMPALTSESAQVPCDLSLRQLPRPLRASQWVVGPPRGGLPLDVLSMPARDPAYGILLTKSDPRIAIPSKFEGCNSANAANSVLRERNPWCQYLS